MGKDVFSKTLGLVGCGNIGQKVAEIVSLAFGCKILYHDVNKNQLLEEIFEAKKVELDELLKTSDIVSLHVPLLPETTHLINKEKLNLMKKNCILINTARGPVVDEKALTQFLKENSNFGAGLDVFELEPKVAQELRDLPNVVFTPHIASAKESARIEMAIAAAQNVINILG
jgi:lactate dehydrogenase-like 2-hydroxyacid dehydrogenase